MNSRFTRWPRATAVAALIAGLIMAGCSSPGTGKAGGAPAAAPTGTITLTFASADPLPDDTAFATLVDQDSGGHLKLRTVSYDARSTSVDQTIAADLQKGKLDVGDVGSRAWESLGIEAFRAYQDPFLITSRELLDAAVTGLVAAGLLATLKPARITGLALAPDSIRYLYSTRPLTTIAQFSGAKIRINDSATPARCSVHSERYR
jgi:TRAP-type C4-dicarboxylate transport system substrate-binding protein